MSQQRGMIKKKKKEKTADRLIAVTLVHPKTDRDVCVLALACGTVGMQNKRNNFIRMAANKALSPLK